MSKRRTEITVPGPPPEDVRDATLRALGEPAPLQARHTPESAGLASAQYQADAHLPPKAHHAAQVDLTTVPRRAARGRKVATFGVALAFVLLVIGGSTYALTHPRADARSGAVRATTEAPGAASADPTPPAVAVPHDPALAVAIALSTPSAAPSAPAAVSRERPTREVRPSARVPPSAAPPAAPPPALPVASPPQPASSRDDLPKGVL
jgi:hypothetical protein